MDNTKRIKAVTDFITANEAALSSTEKALKDSYGFVPVPVDPLAGYTKVAKEGESCNFGTDPVDVAYGANGKYVFKTGLTGVVKFDNGTFGDPAYGVQKGGYATKLPIATPPTPVPVPPPVVTPAKTVIRGTILDSDTGSLPLAKEAGFKCIRPWIGLSWASGQPWNDTNINAANATVAAGFTVIATVNVAEQGTRASSSGDSPDKAPNPQVTVNALSKLDKRVIIQLGNEVNMATYWPKGDVASAAKWYGQVAKGLKALGYKIATPSITWQSTGDIIRWYDAIFANSTDVAWDYMDGHNYPWNVGNFEEVAKCQRSIADKYKVKLMCTEWSRKESIDALAAELKSYVAVADKYYDIHVHFIFSYIEKFGETWPYCVKKGVKTKLFDAFKALNA